MGQRVKKGRYCRRGTRTFREPRRKEHSPLEAVTIKLVKTRLKPLVCVSVTVIRKNVVKICIWYSVINPITNPKTVCVH
jgi:hypothetical protein